MPYTLDFSCSLTSYTDVLTFEEGVRISSLYWLMLEEKNQLAAFSQSWKAKSDVKSLPFTFLRVVLNVQICVLSLTPTKLGSISTVLISCLQMFALNYLRSLHKESALGCGEVNGALGMSMGHYWTPPNNASASAFDGLPGESAKWLIVSISV